MSETDVRVVRVSVDIGAGADIGAVIRQMLKLSLEYGVPVAGLFNKRPLVVDAGEAVDAARERWARSKGLEE